MIRGVIGLKEIEVLLVEDNPVDAMVTAEAFKEAAVPATLRVVQDGLEALDYLRKRGPNANAKRPAFIFLDLNLPKKDGREVLAEIKADPDLRDIPVAILSSSQDEHDIATSYELHANCYIVKPSRLEDLVESAKAIEHFWFQVARLPKGNGL
jgi:two-component system, chemotaxis family, response regulator Rcp1